MVAIESTYSKHDPCLGDLYFVLGEGEEDAVEHLRRQIKKYFFKNTLANKSEAWTECPHRLGERIIVSGFITEEFASSKVDLAVTDVTAMAWVYKEAKREGWEKFDLNMLDTVDAA